MKDTLQSANIIQRLTSEDLCAETTSRPTREINAKTLFYTGGWRTQHHHYHGEHATEISLAADVPAQAIHTDDSTVTGAYLEAERLKERTDPSTRFAACANTTSAASNFRSLQEFNRGVLSNSACEVYEQFILIFREGDRWPAQKRI